jgi:ribonucleoside-diphosphate reductase alpha chain
MQAYDSGYIKGITTYREGTMASVISVVDSENKYSCIEKETPERPKSVPCHIHRITVKGEKWLVFIGLDEGRPFEVFAGKVDLVDVPSAITEGSIIRLKSGVYQLEYDGEIIIKDIGKIFDSSAEEAITRLISLHLKRRTPIYDLIDQLSKSYGTIIDFNKSITRALKKYMKDRETTDKCPTCGANLVYQEGCLSCKSCGMSKCG